jgi:SAM-dependent methyltransferase
MDNKKRRVCPVERAGGLDTRLRALVQNPYAIAAPFINPGATVLDYGCGPGFFTVPMAHLVGESGRVLAVDLQQGMLDMVRYKIQGTLLDGRVSFHLVQGDGAGIDGPVDFVLLFYMVHEIEDKAAFFRRIVTLLAPSWMRPDGRAAISCIAERVPGNLRSRRGQRTCSQNRAPDAVQ